MKIYGLTPQHITDLQAVALKKVGKPSVSALAKQLLLDELEDNPSKINADKPVQSKRLELRLSEQIFEQLKNTADKNGMTVNRYAALVLHSHAAENIALTDLEIQSLRDSNYQLYKIGVNLNQIAKALNSGNATSLTLKELHELHEVIDSNFDKVGELIQAVRRRF